MAQGIHRVDMRLRLGVLRDSAATERQAAAEAAARKHKPTSPTVMTEAQTKAQQAADAKAKEAAEAATKPRAQYHIRPLSESKAIESGATFISESFLFLVAGGLVLFESFRSRRKTTTRREDVDARLVDLEESEKSARKALFALEKELLQLKAKQGESTKPPARILSRDILEVEEEEEEPQEESWWSRIMSYLSFGQNTGKEADAVSEDSKAPAGNKLPGAQDVAGHNKSSAS
jgi:hypothetical protein